VSLHPNPVAENGSTGERTRRVDRHHSHVTRRARPIDEMIDERGLSGSRRSGDPGDPGVPTGPVHRRKDLVPVPRSILDQCDETGKSATIPGSGKFDASVV